MSSSLAIKRSLTQSREAIGARRARRLTSPRYRRKLASSLNRMLRDAEKPPAQFTSVVPLQRREVLRSRDEIEQLVQELVAPDTVHARGVELVHKLLTDGASPLYTPSAEGELDQALRQAHTALLLD